MNDILLSALVTPVITSLPSLVARTIPSPRPLPVTRPWASKITIWSLWIHNFANNSNLRFKFRLHCLKMQWIASNYLERLDFPDRERLPLRDRRLRSRLLLCGFHYFLRNFIRIDANSTIASEIYYSNLTPRHFIINLM